MPNSAYYRPVGRGVTAATDTAGPDERQVSWQVESDPSTAGPWSPALQHAGPPSALAVLAAEAALRAATGRDDLLAVRFTAELARPVPVGPLTVAADIARAGRISATVTSTIRDADGRDCLLARILFLAGADTAPVTTEPAPPGTDSPGDYPEMVHSDFGYAHSIEWRTVAGSILEPGPARVWTRPRRRILDSDRREPSSLQRAVLVGDSASGVSAVLDWEDWSFVNADLDVHLLRPVEGDWLLLDAHTLIGPTGVGLARSTLYDLTGVVGATAQALAVSPRRR